MALNEPRSGTKLKDDVFVLTDLIGEQISLGDKKSSKIAPNDADPSFDSYVMSKSPQPTACKNTSTPGSRPLPDKDQKPIPYCKNEDDFMDVDVCSNIYSSMHDPSCLEGADPRLDELTVNTDECNINTHSKLEATATDP